MTILRIKIFREDNHESITRINIPVQTVGMVLPTQMTFRLMGVATMVGEMFIKPTSSKNGL